MLARFQTGRWLRAGTWLGLLLILALVAGLGFLIYREREALVRYLAVANPAQLISVIAWYLVDLAIYFLVWVAIVQRLGGRTTLANHLRIFCLANAAKRLPGTLWYIGGRALLYRHADIPAKIVLLASGIEALIIGCSGLIVIVAFLFAALPDSLWPWGSAALLALLLVLNPVTLKWGLARTAKGWLPSRSDLASIYAWILGDTLGWAVGGILLFAILTAFEPLPWARLPYTIGAWTAAGTASMLTFFLPSNLGVTEVTLTALLSGIVPAAVAILTALSARLLVTALDLVLGGAAWLLTAISRAE